MIHSVKFKAVLDTHVIYPIVIRDFLFWLAYYELFTPKWISNIFDEWKEVMIRKGILKEEAEKRVYVANLAFPDALVLHYEALVDMLNLPDKKDRHVLAATIKTNANVIVTDIIDLNQLKAIKAFKELALNRRNPNMNEFQVLDSFAPVYVKIFSRQNLYSSYSQLETICWKN